MIHRICLSILCLVIVFINCLKKTKTNKPFVTLCPSSQENIQGGWYAADSGEDEGRAGFSKVIKL